MSYLGSLGSVMGGSGLTKALQCCFGPNAVLHMLAGKAVSRAVRGHFLVEAVLNILLLKTVCNASSDQLHGDPFSELCVLTDNDMKSLEMFYMDLVNGVKSFKDLDDCQIFDKVETSIRNAKKFLAMTSRTAKLWIQYVDCVRLLKLFIRAVRTCNWNLHLFVFSQMLPLFAATGHNNYAKSGRLYLQIMQDLPHTHPLLYEQFVSNKCHAVRRSNKHWAGLSTDLAIEQIMMKALKSRGGLTRGRGLTDSVRLMWVSTMHQMATVHAAITALVTPDNTADEFQHKESGRSRVARDNADTLKILDWFECHNPFDISNGTSVDVFR